VASRGAGEETEEGTPSSSSSQMKKRELTELSKNGPERFMGWVWPLVRMSKLEVAEKCGNDAMIYIHFQVLRASHLVPVFPSVNALH
jgi:hypothetical protein